MDLTNTCVPAGVDGSAGEEGLLGRARGYLEVVRELNRAQVAGESFDAAGRFGAAASRDPPGAQYLLTPSSPPLVFVHSSGNNLQRT